MSNRWWASIIALAVVSAAIGAIAALALRPSSEAPAAAVVEVVEEEPQPEPAQTVEPVQQPQPKAVQEEPAQQPEPQAEQPDEPEPAVEPEPQPQAQQQEQPQQAVEAEPKPPEPEEPPPPDDSAKLVPGTITQGEVVSLTVSSAHAAAAVASVDGRSWNLSEAGPGVWWAVLAVPRDADSGARDVVIDLYGEGGVWLRSLSRPLLILESTAPLEAIVLGENGFTVSPAEVQRDHDIRFVEHVAVSGPPRWVGAWDLPVEGEVTGVFGARRSYDGVMSDSWHHGHDIAAQHGDPLVAPAAGVVVWTGETAIHGLGVILDHGAGVFSGYWHMSLISVEPGMQLERGDWLGNIGSTGLSTGPHLHWEVIVQGIDVDPVQWTNEQRPPLPDEAAVAGSADTLNE